MPPPCWRCWRPCWWRWRPWRWSWIPYRCWRSPRWVEEALMIHSVVIHALMVSWYPRRRPSNPIGDILTPGGLLVWLRLIKKPWRSPSTHTWWINGPCILEDGLYPYFGFWWLDDGVLGHTWHGVGILWWSPWWLDTPLHVMVWVLNPHIWILNMMSDMTKTPCWLILMIWLEDKP